MRYLIAVGIVCGALLVGGCAHEPENRTDTLAGTKPTAQLLRNSAASLIPDDAIQSRESDADESVSCSDDEDSAVRAWRASVRFILEAAFAKDSESIAGGIVSEYESNGWRSETTVDGGTTTWAMHSDATPTTLLISAVGDPDGNGKGATIFVAATGPCVTTDGPDSAEVRELEGQS